MDSSCKYPVSPVDTVSDSMDGLSLLKVPSDESIWPRRNFMVQNVENLYHPEPETNLSGTKMPSFVGLSPSGHILNAPNIAQSCDLTSSTGYDKASDCCPADNSDDKPISGDFTRECDERLAGGRNSSFHQMILRPKTVSPRHCIITLYDDSEDEESSDSDYSVDLDLCDSTTSDEETDSCLEGLSSDEDSSNSEDETRAKEDGKADSSDEDSSDSDEEDSTESSSSDEEEMALSPVLGASKTKKPSTRPASRLTEDSNSCAIPPVLGASSNDTSRTEKPRVTSSLTGDSNGCDKLCETSGATLDTRSETQATSGDGKVKLLRDDRPINSDGSSSFCSEDSSPVCSDDSWTEEELTDDGSVDLGESTDYSSERSDQSA